MGLARRFGFYGVVGWAIEVLMTGACSIVFDRNPSAMARTSLWMHPIYGAGGLLLEHVDRPFARWPRAVRALAYVPVIFAVEAATGALLRRAIGRCPWDYTGRGLHLKGLVRLDYLPLWYLVGYAFDPIRKVAHRLR
jgi:hypothetical protein